MFEYGKYGIYGQYIKPLFYNIVVLSPYRLIALSKLCDYYMITMILPYYSKHFIVK